MELTTQCPECGTCFAASMEQLQLRKGYVRCINCAHIFDGYEAVVPRGATAAALSSVPESTVAPALSSAPSKASPEPFAPSSAPGAAPLPPIRVGRPHEAAARAQGQEPAQNPEPVHFIADTVPAVSDRHTVGALDHHRVDEETSGDFVWRDVPADVADDGSPEREPGLSGSVDSLYVEPRSVQGPQLLPDFLDTHAGSSGFARLLWGGLALLSAVLLIGQAAYVYRVQVASQIPALRPLLEQACQSLDCTVDYPRRLQSIAIMDSSLQAEPGQPSDADTRRMRLRVVLRNTDAKPLEWPALSLELVDFSGGVVARRMLQPGDYLPADKIGGPFAANSETTVVLPITVDGVKINGYQLGKFFP